MTREYFSCLGTEESPSNEDLKSFKPKLAIYPEGIMNGNNRYLMRRVEDTLNLTCRVAFPEGIILPIPIFNMSWDVPKKSQNRYETYYKAQMRFLASSVCVCVSAYEMWL